MTQPKALTRFADETAERFPLVVLLQPNAGIGFLAQNIEPMPLIQPLEDFYRAKFAVTNQKNSRTFWQKLPDIVQQG